MSKQKLLSIAQRAIRNSGLTQAEVARKLGIPPQRVNEFMKAENIHGLKRVEQVLSVFRPDIMKQFNEGHE